MATTLTHARPTPVESPYEVDELFFSTTDPKGIITYGNDVFARVSRYELRDMIGRPHNIVRHEDMPRAVFATFWEFLLSGRPIAAYVKNMASDGSYYWVIAVALPTRDGFVSVRLKPTSGLLDTVQELYAEVREHELRSEGGDVRRRKEAIADGVALLHERLRDLGFGSYEEFMRHALPLETHSRESHRSAERKADVAIADRRLAALHRACADTDAYFKTLLPLLQDVTQIGARLEENSAFVGELGEELSDFALNASISSAALSEHGAVFGALSAMMRTTSRAVTALTDEMGGDITSTLGVIRDLSFRIALSNLQAEMLMQFAESARDEGHVREMGPALGVLTDGLVSGAEDLFTSLGSVTDGIERIVDSATRLERDLKQIQALHVNGRIEAAALTHSAGYPELFRAMGECVDTARDRTRAFAEVDSRPLRTAVGAERTVRGHLGHAQDAVLGLVGGDG